MDGSPPSSPIIQSPPSSPLPSPSPPSSPLYETPPKRQRKSWLVFPSSATGHREPSRATLFSWRRSLHQKPQADSLEVPLEDTDEAHSSSNKSFCNVSANATELLGDSSRSAEDSSMNSSILPFGLPLDISEESSNPEEDNGSLTLSSESSNSGSSGQSERSESDEFSSEFESEHSDEGQDENSEEEELSNAGSDVECSSDASEGDQVHASRSPWLYEGCEKTVDEAVLDIIQSHINNKETKKSLGDHLSTINKYLPKPNNMPKTTHQLLKYVKDLAPSYKETNHFYCSDCLSLIMFEDKDVPCKKCNSLQRKKFYSFSIEDQLKFYFETCKIFELFMDTVDDDCIRDIHDGSEYKRVCIDEGEFNVTLMLNTDGVSVSQSSKTSLYPLQFVICELPPKLRASYMIVCGVWCDDTKPPMNMFLRPFVDILKLLYNNGGFTWKHPDTGLLTASAVIAPLISVDAPVRAQIQNIKSHNGKYACNTCEQKSDRIPLTAQERNLKAQGKNIRRRRAFLFHEQPARLRTNKRMLRQAVKACETGDSVKGVKGPSVLSLLPYIDLSTCVFGEYMHLVLLGIVKLILNLWLEIPGPWSIKNYVSEIDDFLKNIAPPSFIGRLPRGLKDVKHWKASEYRTWLLYYSLPSVSKFLPRQYSQHWALLVMAVYLLLQEEITSKDIEMSEIMLRLFLRDIGSLYRKRDYVYNMHELLHLPTYVKRWGPLWATSTFMFESYNGILTKLIHGSKDKGKELVNNLILAHGVEILRNRVLLQQERREMHTTDAFEGLDQYDCTHLSDHEQMYLSSVGITDIGRIFARLLASTKSKNRKETFTSTLYNREKRRNNHTIMFQIKEGNSSRYVYKYGEVRAFVQKCEDPIVCLIRVFSVQHTRIFFHEVSRALVVHIIPINSDSTDLTVIPCKEIVTKVIRVGDFVCRSPNSIENHCL